MSPDPALASVADIIKLAVWVLAPIWIAWKVTQAARDIRHASRKALRQVGEHGFNAGVEEGRRLVRAEVGICGDLSPAGFDDRRVSCDLLAGHDGWHSHPNDDGVSRMSWHAMDPEVAEVVADTIERWEKRRFEPHSYGPSPDGFGMIERSEEQ